MFCNTLYRWFDAAAMEPYVDWFGFMSYDLHGSWDSDVMTLGSVVRGQTDIREIRNNTLPLVSERWRAGVFPIARSYLRAFSTSYLEYI